MNKSSIRAVRLTVFCGACTLLLGGLGCGSKEAAKAELPAPIVTVAPPIERMVTNYAFATGRVEPIDQVDVRAHVGGYVKTIYFKPGSEVKKGDPLYEIDPEPYKADLAKAKASLAAGEASLETSKFDFERDEKKMTTAKLTYDRQEEGFQKKVISQGNRDIAKGEYDEATAAWRAGKAKVKLAEEKIGEDKANLKTAELNLGYCTITAPISGLIGDRLVTEENLITGGQANSTKLTSIVRVDKMDIGFDPDENTIQQLQRAVRQGKLKATSAGEVPVEAGLAVDGTTYPLKGKITFIDNQLDSKTGTIHVKGRFDNPKPEVGQRMLTAGMYARVRVPIGEPAKAMLVPDSAFGFDQGVRYLFLLGPENKAIRMDATVGMQVDDLRVVESVEVPGSGKPRPLTLQDQVIVSGIQRVRPGMTVDPKSPTKK